MGNLDQRESLRTVDHRHNEALRRGDGKTDVRARMEEDRLRRELRVHLAVPHERLRADLREDVGDGEADVGVALAEPCDEGVDARHVGRGLELEDRDLPRLREPARDRLADVRERDALDLPGRDRGL